MRSVRAADGLRARFADAQRAHFALLHELRHGADRILDRHIRIDAVLVIKIDYIDAEALEAFLARLDHEIRPAVGEFAVAAAEITELGRKHHTGPAILDGLADQLFVMTGAVGVGTVEQGDAVVEGGVNKRNALVVAGLAIDAGQRHAAKTDGGNFYAGRAENALGKSFCHDDTF